MFILSWYLVFISARQLRPKGNIVEGEKLENRRSTEENQRQLYLYMSLNEQGR
jgi:hypothetical protein